MRVEPRVRVQRSRPMTQDEKKITRRVALKTTAATLVGGSLTVVGAGSATADEHEVPPPEVAEIAGIETDEENQQQEAVAFHPGWEVRIRFTTADYRSVRPGDKIYVFCQLRNDNKNREKADVFLITLRRGAELVSKKTKSVGGESSTFVPFEYQTHWSGPRQFDIWVIVNGPGRDDWDTKRITLN